MSTLIREDRSLLERPLRRSRRNRVLAGVCGGVAEWVGWDPTLVRVAFVFLALVTSVFPAAILYAVFAFLLPEDRTTEPLDWWDDGY